MSKIIRATKKPENMDDLTFLKEALKEIQKEQKQKEGKSFQFDIEEREQKLKQKK